MRSSADATAQRYQAMLSWAQIKRFRQRCKLPIIIKGIQTAEDAVIACDHGIDGIYVTNHGGRQLDHGRACKAYQTLRIQGGEWGISAELAISTRIFYVNLIKSHRRIAFVTGQR